MLAALCLQVKLGPSLEMLAKTCMFSIALYLPKGYTANEKATISVKLQENASLGQMKICCVGSESCSEQLECGSRLGGGAGCSTRPSSDSAQPNTRSFKQQNLEWLAPACRAQGSHPHVLSQVFSTAWESFTDVPNAPKLTI